MEYLKSLEGKKILISGATGLIGSNIIKEIISYNLHQTKPVKVIAIVRDKEKAVRLFGNAPEIEYLVCDIQALIPSDIGVNYIIHGASQTQSKAFIDQPVETIMTNVNGTVNMLEMAKANNVESFVYLSSMEVYGSPSTDEKIDESYLCNIDTMSVRSCYPESKRICENLCISYLSEYNIPVKIARLTQTFGPGVAYNDGRVFAEFARDVIECKDIVLKTKGETKRSYIHLEDTTQAILAILTLGLNGQAYNVANESTYCSIFEMAELVVNNFGDKKIKVTVDLSDNPENYGYAPVLKMNLDTTKLKSLGWHANFDLKKMFEDLISYMRDIKK